MNWMTSGINRVLGWLAAAASDGKSGLPSSKRLGFLYLIAVVGGTITGLAGALVYVATVACDGPQAVEAARIVGDTLVWLVGSGLTAVTGSYVGGKAVERKGKPDAAG